MKSLKLEKSDNMSLGYGFFEYLNPEHAEAVIKTLNNHQIQNQSLMVKKAVEMSLSNLIDTHKGEMFTDVPDFTLIT